MNQMRTIEIDFDLHKKIETARTGFDETPNDVLRRLLGIKAPSTPQPASRIEGKAWSGKNVSLPHGTQLRMEYNGRQHIGEILHGAWHTEGKTFKSPSAAAGGVAITRKGTHPSLDGWEYWWVNRPTDTSWVALDSLRH